VHWCVHSEQWTVEQHSLLRRRISWLRHVTWLVLDIALCVRACVRACVCVCDTSVGTLLFATAVNSKPQITKQNIVRICRIIFIFLTKYLSHDRLNDCVITQLSSQFQSFIFSVCWPSSRYIYLHQIFVNHRRYYGYVSPLWRWTWANLHYSSADVWLRCTSRAARTLQRPYSVASEYRRLKKTFFRDTDLFQFCSAALAQFLIETVQILNLTTDTSRFNAQLLSTKPNTCRIFRKAELSVLLSTVLVYTRQFGFNKNSNQWNLNFRRTIPSPRFCSISMKKFSLLVSKLISCQCVYF